MPCCSSHLRVVVTWPVWPQLGCVVLFTGTLRPLQNSRIHAINIQNNVCTGVANCLNTKITLEWAHKQFVRRVHTIFDFLRDITSPQMTIKPTIFTHRTHVAHVRFTFCWWRHNRTLMTSQWPNNCNAITWIVISNLIDNDLFHGDIHGRSCKKFSNASMKIGAY